MCVYVCKVTNCADFTYCDWKDHCFKFSWNRLFMCSWCVPTDYAGIGH